MKKGGPKRPSYFLLRWLALASRALIFSILFILAASPSTKYLSKSSDMRELATCRIRRHVAIGIIIRRNDGVLR